ncbi:hypothetical protein ACL598_21090 [Bordetella bronchialis]|uniref:hypothetical protein n=1 Tax=Bordetella bronchialis TaxID=463025 RepID=UPI003D07CA8F
MPDHSRSRAGERGGKAGGPSAAGEAAGDPPAERPGFRRTPGIEPVGDGKSGVARATPSGVERRDAAPGGIPLSPGPGGQEKSRRPMPARRGPPLFAAMGAWRARAGPRQAIARLSERAARVTVPLHARNIRMPRLPRGASAPRMPVMPMDGGKALLTEVVM